LLKLGAAIVFGAGALYGWKLLVGFPIDASPEEPDEWKACRVRKRNRRHINDNGQRY